MNFGGIIPRQGGFRKLLMCFCWRPISCGEEEKHVNKIPRKSRDNPGLSCLFVFVFDRLFFAPDMCCPNLCPTCCALLRGRRQAPTIKSIRGPFRLKACLTIRRAISFPPYSRRVPPCTRAVKTCAVRPVFAWVVGVGGGGAAGSRSKQCPRACKAKR